MLQSCYLRLDTLNSAWNTLWCCLRRGQLAWWLLLQLPETGELVHQDGQYVDFMCRIVYVDHVLPDLIPEREELSAKLVEAESCLVVVFLWGRDRGRRCGRVDGISGCLHPLCHVPKLLDSALSETHPQGSEVEHPNVAVLVVALIARCPSLRMLAASRGCLTVSRGLRLLVLAGRKAQPQDHTPGAVRGRLLSVPGHRAPASGADLLPLQPALEAAKVQDVATRKLLGTAALHLHRVGGIPGAHFLSANDARVLSAELFCGGVGILGHVLQGLAVANEGMEPLEEGPGRHKPIPHNVDRQAIKAQEDAEKRRVEPELDEVWEPC